MVQKLLIRYSVKFTGKHCPLNRILAKVFSGELYEIFKNSFIIIFHNASGSLESVKSNWFQCPISAFSEKDHWQETHRRCLIFYLGFCRLFWKTRGGSRAAATSKMEQL